jgi:hypothetical protein
MIYVSDGKKEMYCNLFPLLLRGRAFLVGTDYVSYINGFNLRIMINAIITVGLIFTFVTPHLESNYAVILTSSILLIVFIHRRKNRKFCIITKSNVAFSRVAFSPLLEHEWVFANLIVMLYLLHPQSAPPFIGDIIYLVVGIFLIVMGFPFINIIYYIMHSK